LRAIAEALADAHAESFGIRSADHAVQPVAPASLELDAEHCDRIAILHAGIGGIGRGAPPIDIQDLRIRRGHEARSLCPHRRPDIAFGVDGAEDDKRQHWKEGAVLLRHRLADEIASGSVHAFDDPDAALHGELTLMPG